MCICIGNCDTLVTIPGIVDREFKSRALRIMQIIFCPIFRVSQRAVSGYNFTEFVNIGGFRMVWMVHLCQPPVCGFQRFGIAFRMDLQNTVKINKWLTIRHRKQSPLASAVLTGKPEEFRVQILPVTFGYESDIVKLDQRPSVPSPSQIGEPGKPDNPVAGLNSRSNIAGCKPPSAA